MNEFRANVRAFLAEKLPTAMRWRHDAGFYSAREDSLAWQRILHERGWGAPGWPEEHGGTGWSSEQRLIFEQECALAGAPIVNIQALGLVGPIINAFGTVEQRDRFIPPMLRGDVFWCQGFSEPGAGSDLASLRTKAERRGDDYVVNGSKIWTSHAQMADWVFLLVRTSEGHRKHDGITLLLADMRTPGISISPIISIDGLHTLNQTFYDDVHVPAANVVGGEGNGWNVARHLLGNERMFGSTDLPGIRRDLERIKVVAAMDGQDGRLIDDDSFADRLVEIETRVLAVESMLLRATAPENVSDVTLMGSVLKVSATELHQAITELLFEALGEQGSHASNIGFGETSSIGFDRVGAELMYRRAASIYAGTNEIQRNLIARAVLERAQ